MTCSYTDCFVFNSECVPLNASLLIYFEDDCIKRGFVKKTVHKYKQISKIYLDICGENYFSKKKDMLIIVTA